MQAWAGLGYYSRARNLHACAQAVVGHARRPLSGRPRRSSATLPGIGAYTAAAIAAIAFNRPAAAVDGNVERVISRLFRVEEPLPAAKAAIKALTESLVPPDRPGDFAQALMDLGATICTPKRPACALCPWSGPCGAGAAGLQESFPRKAAKTEGRAAARRRLRGDCAPTARFCCARGPPRVCSAAWPSRRRAPGRPDYDPARRGRRRARRGATGSGSPESSGTASRISRSS